MSILSYILTAIGATDTVATSSGAARDVNAVAQVAAAAAGAAVTATAGNPVAGAAAVTAGEAAAATGISVFAQDAKTAVTDWQQTGSLSLHDMMAVASDTLSVVGDLAIVVGGVASQVPTGQGIAAAADGIGAGATLLGVAANHADTVNNFVSSSLSSLSNVVNNDIAGILATAAAVSTASQAADALSSALQYIKPVFNDIIGIPGASAAEFDSDSSAANTAFQNSETSLGNSFTSTGAATQNVTETASGDTVTFTSSNSSVPTDTATTSVSSDGSSTGTSITGNNGGLSTTETDSLNSDGSLTDTVQNTSSSISVNYTQTTTTPTSGTTSVAISGQGDDTAVSDANVWLNTGTAATLSGTGNAVTTCGTDTLTLDTAGNTVYDAGDGNVITATGSQTVTAAGNNEQITTGGGTVDVNAGTGDTVSLSNGTLWLNGNVGVGTVGTGFAGIALDGTGNSITTSGGDSLILNNAGNAIWAAGDGNTVTSTGDQTITEVGNNSKFTIGGGTVDVNSGTGDIIVASNDPNLWLNGGVGSGTVGSGFGITVAGSGDTVTTSGNNTLFLDDPGLGNTVYANGDSNSITADGAESVHLGGSNDTFTLGNGSWVGLGIGSNDAVGMSNGSMWTNTGTDAAVYGNSDQLLTSGGATTAVILDGSGDSLYADNPTSVTVEGNGAYGTADTVTDASGTVTLASDSTTNGARADIYGANLTVDVTGPNENVGIHDSGVTYNDNPTDGTSDGLWLGGNMTNLTMNGSGETITANYGGDAATVNGSNVLIDSTVSGNSFTVNGQQETVDASNDSITIDQGGFAYVNGTDDGITANNNDAVVVSSPTDALSVNGFVQQLTAETTTGSELYFYNDPTYSNTSDLQWLYNQTDATGDLTELNAAFTTGGSQDTIYDYNSSNQETGFTVTDYDSGGSATGSGSYDASGNLLSTSGNYSGYISYSDAGNAFAAAQGVGQGKPVDVSAIVTDDNSHGDTDAAQAAQAAGAWVGFLETNEASMSDTAKRHAVFEGGRWDSSVITWSIGRGPGTGPAPFSGALGSQYEAIVAQAFAAWGKASGLTFREVADSPQADITIGWSKLDPANSGLMGFTSGDKQNGDLQQGVTIQLEDPTEDQLTVGSNGQLTYQGTQTGFYDLVMHEIGHALGLADNADPNSVMYYAGGNGTLDGGDLTGITALYGAMPGNAGPAISLPTATGGAGDVSLQQFVQAVASMSGHTASVTPSGTTPFDFSGGDPVRPGWLATPTHAQAA